MITRLAVDKILGSLDRIEYGSLELITPDGKARSFEGQKPGAAVKLELEDWSVITNVARKGDIGLAEDYRAGKWNTDNLQGLFEVGLQNRNAFQKFVLGGTVSRTVSKLSYLLRLNTLRGSRKNIHAHYDLGNAFYSLWLDPTMTYSAALFKQPNDSLTAAQHNKYDRIIDCIGRPSGNLLEIGCGWGGFAERAVERGDFDIKGITLSEEQHQYANKRLCNKAEVALEDYRHQEGMFDNIVSIEMFEAVGERYWNTYFNKIGSLLKKNGTALIQTITIKEEDFFKYRQGGDFIRSYIFPGGMLPAPSRFKEEAEKSGLKAGNDFYFGKDYARTLEHWLHRFEEKEKAVKELGFDDGFIRLWRFYLAACAAGFKTGRTDVMQIEVSHA